jgi:dienelactone hydrolase
MNGMVWSIAIRQTADAFAEQGYIALAADLYSGEPARNREENIELVREVRAAEDHDRQPRRRRRLAGGQHSDHRQ